MLDYVLTNKKNLETSLPLKLYIYKQIIIYIENNVLSKIATS